MGRFTAAGPRHAQSGGGIFVIGMNADVKK